MATPFAEFYVFKVKNDLQSSNISCKTLEAILKETCIDADICEHNDGWLIRIDNSAIEVLSKEDYILLGKYDRKPYNLSFSSSSEQFPDQEDIQSENNEYEVEENTEIKQPFETPPGVGQDRQPDPRTIIVHDVPKTVDSEALQLYFENPKSSKGGKITSFEIDKKNEIKITFESSAVARAVLEKESHVFSNSNLRVSMYILPQTEDKQVVISDFKPKITDETVKNFLEANISSEMEIKSVKKVKTGTFFVYFAEKIDIEQLKILCKNNTKAYLSDTYPKVKGVPVPTQIIVSNYDEKMTKESVKNYFSHPLSRDDIVGIKELPANRFVITFKNSDHIDLLKILCKNNTKAYLSDTYPKVKGVPVPTQIIVSNYDEKMTKESVKNYFSNPLSRDDIVGIKELPANRFVITFKNSDLAKEMSQAITPKFEINLYHDCESESSNETYKEISLPSPFLLNFIKDQRNVFEDQLKDYGYLDFSKSNGNLLKIMCYNDKEEEEEIKKRVDELVARINEEKVTILSDLFDEVKEMPVKDKDLNIYFDKENLTAHIFSFNKSSSSDCKQNISKFIEQKFNANKEVPLETHKIILLFSDFFPSKIFPKYKKVDITLEGSKVVFCGFSPDIDKVISEMYKYLSDIKVTQIQLPRNFNEISNNKEVKQYLCQKLNMKGCPCAWEINPDNQVYLYTGNKVDAESAKEIFSKSIVELNFHLNDPKSNILKEKKWEEKLQDLSNKYADNFHVDVKNKKLSVVTTDQIAAKIESELETFFDTNAVYKQTLSLKLGVYNFLMRFESSAITDFVNKHPPLKILFENDQVIQICGTKQLNIDASTFLKNLITGVIEQKETFPHLGFKKFLKTDLADTVLEKVSNSNKCIILKDEDAAILGKTSIYQIKYANSEIILQLKDITELDVDAIVSSAKRDLKHIAGLSLAIIRKGGDMIQEECNVIMKKTGNSLNKGVVKVTSAGNLRCRFIMHAVGPVWEDGKNYETEFLSDAITNALDEAERENLNSIAIPALCTGTLGFPINKATEVIVRNIKKYLDDNPKTKLKSIYLISLKNNIINAFHNQLNSTFPESTNKATSGPSEQKKPAMKSRTNIEIEYGLLNKTQCDVIVNTTNQNLNLSQGQISKALLADAGPKLQEECNRIQDLQLYDVAVTGGYNLPSKAVFHIFLPYWSKSSVQHIKTCIQNCLRKADQEKYFHIAFPAFGTGMLGYPPDVVANEMVRATSEYISTERTALQKISFVIYPGNNNLYEAFENAKGMEASISMPIDPTYQPNVNKNTATPMSQQGDKLEMDIKGIKLIVQKGNLIKQTTDAIVHGTNKQLHSMGAISQVLLKEIGPQLTNDCKDKVAEMKANNYALTPGHSLSTSWILHINIEEITNNATQIFKKCFDAAESNQLTSLAVPPIGTGRKIEKFVSKETEPSAVNLFISAKNLDTIKKAKAEIDSKYMNDVSQKTTITHDVIDKLSQNQKKRIHELQNEHDVKIEFQLSSINVSGYKDDFETVTKIIYNLLLASMEEIKSVEMTNSKVLWSYMTTENNKPEIVPYPSDINHQLEKAYEKNQTNLEIDGNQGKIIFDISDPKNMIEYKENDKANPIKILRKDRTKFESSLPEDWDPMEDEDYLKVELKPGPEFDTVKNKFPTNFTIVKIERIQRKSLYIQYQAQLQKMNLINPKHVQNETRDLWHGTREDVTEKINKSGFDRGYCGKNATVYGEGVYFAKDVQYSLRETYSPQNSKKQKHLYLCNVLTGMFCKGDTSMKVLPLKPNSSDRPYDSAVDDVKDPTMFITFHDVNAYPAYLITCS